MADTSFPLLLDCDPGVDDALAILWLLAHPERFDLRAITCVAGNVGLDRTCANACRVLDLAGRQDIQVFAGAHRPIMAGRGKTSAMHGGDGLGDIGLPAPSRPAEGLHGAQAIIEEARAQGGRLHVCATGPLTNLALALLLEPALPDMIEQITLMGGGAFVPGNTTPVAEFNFHVDPHAAAIVFDSGIPITMAGLDVTRQALLSEAARARIEALGDPIGAPCAALLRSYGAKDPCLHDPVVVAWLLRPELFERVPAHVSIDTAGGDTAGQVIASVVERHLRGRPANVSVLTGMDVVGFEALFVASMETLHESLGSR
jgi:inosine-uridine nucleoside N-ribohydrolase